MCWVLRREANQRARIGWWPLGRSTAVKPLSRSRANDWSARGARTVPATSGSRESAGDRKPARPTPPANRCGKLARGATPIDSRRFVATNLCAETWHQFVRQNRGLRVRRLRGQAQHQAADDGGHREASGPPSDRIVVTTGPECVRTRQVFGNRQVKRGEHRSGVVPQQIPPDGPRHIWRNRRSV